LRGSDDNPPDLSYNSNEPSNAVRPGGLGGTPIRKTTLKEESYAFTVGITRCGTVHSIGFVIFVGIWLCRGEEE
jgi:hypothetical protein